MKNLDDKVIFEIDVKIKELLELLNKKSENELILRTFKVDSVVSIDDYNVLQTDYTISFSTVLMEKENG